MTRERAKELAPIIAAYGEGKAVQYRECGNWIDCKEYNFPKFNPTDCGTYRIKPEPKKRLMTSNEVLGFVTHNPHIVISYDNGDWALAKSLAFDDVIQAYRWATIDAKGNIGEPHKFEVEEP